MNRIPIITNPKMFDAVVAEIQTYLGGRFQWLDHVFGIAEKIIRYNADGRKFTCATVFMGDEQYVQVEPCKELGNFCFFVLRDPQTVNTNDRDKISAPFSVIFWYDMRQVSSEPTSRNREDIKGQILQALNAARPMTGNLSFNKIYEDPEKIFSDYSYDHTHNQFLMSPYAGIRIDGEITTTIPCYD